MRSAQVLAWVGLVGLFSCPLLKGADAPPFRMTPLQIGLWGQEAQLFAKDREVWGLRLNLPWSENKVVNGLDFGVVNQADQASFVLQAGLDNGVRKRGAAVQLGVMNVIGDGFVCLSGEGDGLQAGLVNWLQDGFGFQLGAGGSLASAMTGLQLGGLLCFSEDVDGAQAGGMMCSAGRVRGLQAGGLLCGAEDVRGLQASVAGGCYAETVRGVQAGFGLLPLARNDGATCLGLFSERPSPALYVGGNYTEDLVGLQVGLFCNRAGKATGVQVGLVNIASALTGLQVGLVNVIRGSSVPVLPVVNAHF